jgi:ribosomal small subunit protein bTHX
MGKGDKKSKKGKIFKGSYGVSRNKKSIKLQMKRASSKKAPAAAAAVETPAKAKRVVKKKTEA